MKDRKQPKATLSRVQARALPILLSAPSVARGCRLAGISRDRYYDWMKDSTFRAEFDKQSDELVRDSIRLLKLNGVQAVESLSAFLQSRNEALRLKAIIESINYLHKFRELELDERITRLEQNKGNKPRGY